MEGASKKEKSKVAACFLFNSHSPSPALSHRPPPTNPSALVLAFSLLSSPFLPQPPHRTTPTPALTPPAARGEAAAETPPPQTRKGRPKPAPGVSPALGPDVARGEVLGDTPERGGPRRSAVGVGEEGGYGGVSHRKKRHLHLSTPEGCFVGLPREESGAAEEGERCVSPLPIFSLLVLGIAVGCKVLIQSAKPVARAPPSAASRALQLLRLGVGEAKPGAAGLRGCCLAPTWGAA